MKHPLFGAWAKCEHLSAVAKKSPTIGQCKLCLAHDVELQDSHIMPRFSYVRLRGPGPQDEPVHMRDAVAFQSSEQVTEPLLCWDCEQRIGKVEGRVAALLPLRDGNPAPILGRLGGLVEANDDGIRIVKLGRVSGDDLAYFAASILWRGHVSKRFPVRLGERYAEEFRLYLIGETPFPENAACVAYFYDLPFADEVDMKATSVGVETFKRLKGSSPHWHGFMIFGLRFVLQVGSQLDARMVEACLVRHQRLFLARQEHLLRWLGRSIRAVKPDQKLERALDAMTPTAAWGDRPTTSRAP